MVGAASVGTVIDRIHDAALDEAQWPDAIAAIAESCRAVTGILYEFDVARWESQIVGTYRMSPEFMADYRNHYAALDPWSRRSMVAEVGRATCTPELIADADLRRTEFYQDYLRPHGDLFYGLGGVIERTSHRIAILGVQRSHRAGVFDVDCIAVIERIMPHLRHSYRVRHAMRKADQQCATLRETLHALPNPVLILDRDARIDRNYGSNAMWGWIAGAVVLVLMLVFLFGGPSDNANTASNQSNAPVVNTPPANNIANAPRGTVNPPAASETTGQSSSPSQGQKQ